MKINKVKCVLKVLFVVLFLSVHPASAQTRATDIFLSETRTTWQTLAQIIWEKPEVGLQEKISSAELVKILEEEGFTVKWGVGGLKTAFVATVGSGAPVVGLLAEYDALPGLSQVAGKAKKEAVIENGPGHGCGHNLLSTASVAAAIAANRERIARKLPGTLQVFGTPAEEILIGKTFMVRDGAFQKTDVVLTWHPDEQNRVINRTRLAVAAVDVEFFGRSSHASGSPWLGRSSLDALVLFDTAGALMREHIKPTARIHRIIKHGGSAANIIPDYTKGEYWMRDSTGDGVNNILERLKKAADGAALATETQAKVSLLFSVRDIVPNDSLGKLMQKHLDRLGPPVFDDNDVSFAKALQKELGFDQAGLSMTAMPYTPKNGGTASSDIGEVSAAVPLAEVGIVTRPLGTAAHHWVQTSCSSNPIGWKGMMTAAKILAASSVDLLSEPAIVKAAKEEFKIHTQGKPYLSPLAPETKPPAH